jgi:FdhD protein
MSHTPDYPDYVEVPIKRFSAIGTNSETGNEALDTVVVESNLTVLYSSISVDISSCSPSGAKYLALGHLITRRLLRYTDQVMQLRHLPEKNGIYVETQQTGAQETPEQASLVSKPYPMFDPGTICEVFDDLLNRSSLFRMTGASHAAALCDNKGILLWHEDIGRHNAVDKVIGHAFLERLPLNNKMVALTGRINSEIVDKMISAQIPVVASKAPPTDVAVRIANKTGVTIVGFVRNRRMTVYSNSERVIGINPAGREHTEPGHT